jgi:C4-dicarboxylate transporter DctM subunit
MLIAGAMVFNYVITVENIPKAIAATLKTWEMSQFTFLLMVNALLLLLGCVLEGTTILFVFVPVLLPTAQALGVDLVHFGVMVVVNIMIGLCTPPYGLLLFMMEKVTGVPLKDIVRELIPFLGVMLLMLVLITYVPWLTLVIPRLFGYQG